MKNFKQLFCIFYVCFTVASCDEPDIPNVIINEVNAFIPNRLGQFVELISVDQIGLHLDNFTLIFFDQDGIAYYNKSLVGQVTYQIAPNPNGLCQMVNTPLQTNSSAAVALYYMLDEIIPSVVEFDNPNHILVDAMVYKPAGYSLPISLNLQRLMAGQPLVESTDYNYNGCGNCDPSLSRCRGYLPRYGPSYVNAKDTPGQPNLCPAVNFVLNEFHVNLTGGLDYEFVEIRTSLDPPAELDLTNVTLVVIDSTLKNIVYQVSLNGFALNSDGYFTVGDSTVCSASNPNCIDLQVQQDPAGEFLPSGTGAICLFYGNLTFNNLDAMRDHLIDSIIYTTNTSDPNGELTAAFVPGQGPIYLLSTDDTPTHPQSVSRAECCLVRNQSLYAWTPMSPDAANILDNFHLIKPVAWSKQQNWVRISEVLFEQNATTLNMSFVELYVQGSVDLSGLVVVFYSASTEEIFLMCSCMNVANDINGFAECPCETNIITDVHAASSGAIVLQYGTEGTYEYGNASYGASVGFVDVLLYQLSGDTTVNPLQKYFAPDQVYYTRSSTNAQQQIDISRCYGINDDRYGWQASFVIAPFPTRMAPNICPNPHVYVNELHFNPTYVELSSDPEELPLDGISLVFIIDQDHIPIVNLSMSLSKQTMESNGLFTLGKASITDLNETLVLEPDYPSVVAVYWNVTVLNGSMNPSNAGLLSSVVYSDNLETTSPDELKIFGSTMYKLDTTGQCSLAQCESKVYQSDYPSPNVTNACNQVCLVSTVPPLSTTSSLRTTFMHHSTSSGTTLHHSSRSGTTEQHHSSSGTTEVHHSPTSEGTTASPPTTVARQTTTVHYGIQNTVRLSEIHIDIAKFGHSINFMFAEVFAPTGIVDLSGLSIVFYSTYTNASYAVCGCNGVQTNEQGYGVCNDLCTPLTNYNSTVAFAGAIALQFAEQSLFKQPMNVAQGSTMNVTDVILYQISGNLVDNPLKQYFVTNEQHYQIAPPKQSDYSIVRCFGDPTSHAKWQASFTTTFVETPDAPNNCSIPTMYMNEIHFNETFIELAIGSIELPLDQATIAFVADNGTDAIVTEMFSMYGQNAMESSYFTVGNVAGSDYNTVISLPTQSPVAIVLYWNVTIKANTVAPTTGFLSSVIYSLNDTLSVPPSLAPFSDKSYSADLSGQCSLSVCTDDSDIFDYAPPTVDGPNDCSHTCPGGSVKTTIPPTKGSTSGYSVNSLFINELYYDYESKYSYIELSINVQLNEQSYYLFFFTEEDGKFIQTDLVNVNIVINPNDFWVATNNISASNANLTAPNINLVPNGPGAVVLAMKVDSAKVETLDVVFYTTNAESTIPTDTVLKVNTTGYAIVDASFEPYTSISRCLPELIYQLSFVDSFPTMGSTNQCPSVYRTYVLDFYNLQLNCESVTFLPIGQAGWQAVLAQVIPLCNCGLTEYSLNWNGQNLKDQTRQCISQGVRTTVDMFGVDEEQLSRFTEAYNQYLSTFPTLSVDDYNIQFTNGTAITIKGPKKTDWPMIIGIIVAVVVVLIIIVVIVSIYCVHRRNKSTTSQPENVAETAKKNTNNAPNWTLKDNVFDSNGNVRTIQSIDYGQPVDELLINRLGTNLISDDLKL